jgi:hypothetical protein
VVYGKDIDGKEASRSLNYASAVEILLYLWHSQPDISFAMHHCARFTHFPKQSHKISLIQNGRYLNDMLMKGLILNPSSSLKLIAIKIQILQASECKTTSKICIVCKAEMAM